MNRVRGGYVSIFVLNERAVLLLSLFKSCTAKELRNCHLAR